MTWNRSTAIGLAKASCAFCLGHGMRPTRHQSEAPCRCVFRAVFRACYNRFRECAAKGECTSTVSLEFCDGREGRRTYSRKREEYMADFCLVSRRVLDNFEHRLFRYHFLLGADWQLCCRQMGIDRGTFFHAVYDIEQKLGRAFAEIEPYPLYPVNEYFGGVIQRSAVVHQMPALQQRPILKPTLKKPSIKSVRRRPISMLEAVKQCA
jgi:hypothetical protein